MKDRCYPLLLLTRLHQWVPAPMWVSMFRGALVHECTKLFTQFFGLVDLLEFTRPLVRSERTDQG